MSKTNEEFQYDVALSFAGEQREYVEAVAKELKRNGIEFFYDKFEQVNTWGESLIDYFEGVFSTQARTIVMFISQEYATKAWPDYERQVILTSWIEKKAGKKLLPVRFDDSKIKGLPSSMGYLKAEDMKPEELARAIMDKIGKIHNTTESSRENVEPKFRLPKKVVKINPYEERKKFISFVADELKRRCTHISEFDFFEDDIGDKKQIRILQDGDVLYALDIHKKGMDGGGSGISFSYGERSDRLSGYNAWGDFEWDPEKNEVVLNLNDMSLFDYFGGHQDSKLRYEDFVEKLWNKIIDLLENDNN